MSLESARGLVGNGAVLLDDKFGEWASLINTEILDTCNLGTCVLGQLYGAWDEGLAELGLVGGDAPEWGFDLSLDYPDEGFANFEELDEAWLEAIEARR